jgi:hypothetical protein
VRLLVLAKAPLPLLVLVLVLAGLPVLAHLVVEAAVPPRLLSRQSCSAAMAGNTP